MAQLEAECREQRRAAQQQRDRAAALQEARDAAGEVGLGRGSLNTHA
jgi:hypothetical protein